MSYLRILLAEDGADNQAILRAYLERLGAAVTIAEDGQDALDRALAAEPDAPFSIVFMDVDMPRMGGLSATRALRRAGFAGPIVALTARSTDADREASLAAGCDDHLTKPTTLDALRGAIRRFAPAAPRESGVVARVLVSEYADDDEMMQIVRPFVKALPQRAAAIEAALAAGDLPLVKRLAHQLKGSAGGYGFPSITAAASAIDKSVAAGEKADKIRGRVDELAKLALIARASVPPPSMRNEGEFGATDGRQERREHRALGA